MSVPAVLRRNFVWINVVLRQGFLLTYACIASDCMFAGAELEKLRDDRHDLLIEKHTHKLLEESLDLKREISSATKRAQRIRHDDKHEATVVLSRIPFEEEEIKSQDNTVRQLTIAKFEARREIAVLSHPEILYVSSCDERAEAGDDEGDDPAVRAQRRRKRRPRRHNALLVTRALFEEHVVGKRPPTPAYGRIQVYRESDYASFAKLIVPYSEVLLNLETLVRSASDDEANQEEEEPRQQALSAGNASPAASVDLVEQNQLSTSCDIVVTKVIPQSELPAEHSSWCGHVCDWDCLNDLGNLCPRASARIAEVSGNRILNINVIVLRQTQNMIT